MKIFVLFLVLAAAVVMLMIYDRRTAGRRGDAAGADDPARIAPPDEERAYRPFTPSPPIEPVPFDGPPVYPPEDLAGLRTLERVSDNLAVVDVALDGREALAMHDATAFTLFDVATGRALKTWPEAAPAPWLSHFGEDFCASAQARRLLLGWSKKQEAGAENVLIDLERRTAARVYESIDGQASLQKVVMGAEGRFAAGLVTYGKSHAAFDLDSPNDTSAEEQAWGQFGDIVLESGDIWPEMAMSRDGRWLAFEQGGGDVLVLELTNPPADRDAAEPWEWPDYREHMTVIGDDLPASLDFSPNDDRLASLEQSGGLSVANLTDRDFRILRPFPEPGSEADDYVFLGLTWLLDRNQAIVEMLLPTPKLVLVDLAEGTVLRDWPVAEETLRRLVVARTGGYALVHGDGGMVYVLPLLEDASQTRPA